MERVPSLLQTANPEKVGAGVMKGLGGRSLQSCGIEICPSGGKRLSPAGRLPLKGLKEAWIYILSYLGGTAGNWLSSHIKGMRVFYFADK